MCFFVVFGLMGFFGGLVVLQCGGLLGALPLTLKAKNRAGAIGATSDHTVVDTAKSAVPVGSEMKIGMNYNALMQAMSAPDVAKVVHSNQKMNGSTKERETHTFLTLV